MLTVSDTAYSIAAIRALESEKPEAERIFEDPYARVFAAAGTHAAAGTALFISLPFFRDAIRLRTRSIDDFVREGLSAGLTQIVLMGAGLDARGMRMPEIARVGARVYEVDFPALLEKKRAILEEAGVTVPEHIAHVPCDFGDEFAASLTAGLEARGFRAGAGVIFVWEGVLPYIDQNAIDRCLRFMASIGGAGSRLAVEYWAEFFAPDSALNRVQKMGFTRLEEASFDALWRRYLPGEPHENAATIRLGVAFV